MQSAKPLANTFKPTQIKPKSKNHWLELRAEDITSTEVSCLFSLNPYMSPYELFHLKKNKQFQEVQENNRMKWGSRLEPAIALGIAEDYGWEDVKPMKDYWRIESLRLGSSFDFFIGDDGILEIKNVDSRVFYTQWDENEAPAHIELQVQHQLLISGRKFAYIGALVGGNEICVIKRTASLPIQEQILKKVDEFWTSIKEGNEPPADFEKDAKFIQSLYQNVEDGKTIEPNDRLKEIAQQYKEASDLEKAYYQKKQSLKAEALTIIGDAHKVKGDNFTISCGMKKDGWREAGPVKGGRMFSIRMKKGSDE